MLLLLLPKAQCKSTMQKHIKMSPNQAKAHGLVKKHMRPTFRATNPGLPFLDHFHGLYNLGPFRLKKWQPCKVAQNVGHMCLFTNPCALAWFGLILMCFCIVLLAKVTKAHLKHNKTSPNHSKAHGLVNKHMWPTFWATLQGYHFLSPNGPKL